MRTELFHLGRDPTTILPKGGRILTIMSANTGTSPAEIQINVEPNQGPTSILSKRTIQPNATLSVLANKDDKIRLNQTQNITAQCNSGSADILVAWIGAGPSDPTGGSSSSSNSSSSSSSSSNFTCTQGSDCPPPNQGTCQGCGCFELITLSCTQQGSSGPCECTQTSSTWVKCEDCPPPTFSGCNTVSYCTGNSIPCCGDQCNPSGPNSDGDMCPEGEKCCQGKCCPKKPDGSVKCAVCENETLCIDENTIGNCLKISPVNPGEFLCTQETEENCQGSPYVNWSVCDDICPPPG